MVIDRPHETQTVFDLFAMRARRRSTKSLVNQTVACIFTGMFVVMLDSGWWPVAAGVAAGASYATWGLLDRKPPSRFTTSTLRALAAITAILAMAAVVGVGLAAFTGDGRSPYGTCYEANGRAFACDAHGQRRS